MAFLIYRRLRRGDPDPDPVPRRLLPCVNPITLYTDVQFTKSYRLPKEAIIFLGQELIRHGFKGPLHGREEDPTISAVLTVSNMYYYIPVHRNTALLSSHRGCSKDKIRSTLVLRPSTKLFLLLFRQFCCNFCENFYHFIFK